jgi:hypothetical protein
MTSKPIKYATATSLNKVDLHWPYGPGIGAQLVLRRHPRYKYHAYVELDKGQILCPSYEDCVISVRFDDAPPVRFSAIGAADSTTEVLFVRNATKFTTRLRTAKRVIIELPMYQDGNRTWEFRVDGLKPI